MASTKTLDQLVLAVRRRADMENTQFVTDAEIEQYIQDSLGEYYDLIIAAAGPEFFAVKTACTLTEAGVQSYAFLVDPSGDPVAGEVAAGDVYRVLGVEIEIDGVWRSIRPYSIAQRNDLNDNSGWPNDSGGVFYRVRAFPPAETFTGLGGVVAPEDCEGVETGYYAGLVLDFSPVPRGTHHWRAWVIVVPSDLSHDDDGAGSGDTGRMDLYGFAGWDEYVVCDVCAKILEKEESFDHADRFLMRKQVTGARIQQAASDLNRDWGGAARNIDAEWRANRGMGSV